MDATERLGLLMIAPGQAQKELAHNEALLLLDAIVAAAVEEVFQNDPPQSPAIGAGYLIGDTPSGKWAPYPGHIAAFSSAGWRFVAPVIGLKATVKSTGVTATYLPTGWEVGPVRASQLLVEGEQVVGPQAQAIAEPAGGTVIDSEARNSIAELLSALRQHGLIASD